MCAAIDSDKSFLIGKMVQSPTGSTTLLHPFPPFTLKVVFPVHGECIIRISIIHVSLHSLLPRDCIAIVSNLAYTPPA